MGVTPIIGPIMENYPNLFMASVKWQLKWQLEFNRMHFFKNISVQLVLSDRSFRPKVTVILKYQMETNDNIWFFYCRETWTQQIMKLVLAKINGALREWM